MIVVKFKDGKRTHEVTLADADHHGNEYDDAAAAAAAEQNLRAWAEHGTVKVGDTLELASVDREA